MEAWHVHQVERMMGDGAKFEEVEDWIEHLELSDDEKSACWLVAWALQVWAWANVPARGKRRRGSFRIVRA